MKPQAQKPICRHCKSDNVLVDACAAWCIDSQSWQLSSTYDAAYCAACDGETKIQWVEK